MSQPPETPDPYLSPAGDQQRYQAPSPGPFAPQGQDRQPDAQQPQSQQRYPQTGATPAYQPQGYGGAGQPRSQDEVRRDKPASAVRLVQAMLAGAVVTVLSSAYAIFALDDIIAASLPDIEQVAVDLGTDTSTVVELATTFGVVAILVGTVVGAGLWLLFAWLFSRGQARVVGTVLGGLNALGTLLGLLGVVDAVELLLQLLSLVVVVLALVLLWLPTTSAWFRAVKVAGNRGAWS